MVVPLLLCPTGSVAFMLLKAKSAKKSEKKSLKSRGALLNGTDRSCCGVCGGVCAEAAGTDALPKE